MQPRTSQSANFTSFHELTKLCPGGQDSAPLQHFVSTTCLVRYLRARSWKIKDAIKMLQATIEWRKQYKPEEIGWDDIKSEADTGKQ